MSDSVINSIIAGTTAIIVALLSIQQIGNRKRIRQIGERTERIRYQVENDHPENLREEQDKRHMDNTRLITQLVTSVNGLREDMRDNKKHVKHAIKQTNKRIDDWITHYGK